MMEDVGVDWITEYSEARIMMPSHQDDRVIITRTFNPKVLLRALLKIKESLIYSEIPAAQGCVAIFQSRKRLKNEEKEKSHFLLFFSE